MDSTGKAGLKMLMLVVGIAGIAVGVISIIVTIISIQQTMKVLEHQNSNRPGKD